MLYKIECQVERHAVAESVVHESIVRLGAELRHKRRAGVISGTSTFDWRISSLGREMFSETTQDIVEVHVPTDRLE